VSVYDVEKIRHSSSNSIACQHMETSDKMAPSAEHHAELISFVSSLKLLVQAGLAQSV
jgi:hypothetical protein